ncbi:MAG: MBL fold metallo-hydrolase [Candidatus Marinimicrobia bacterium]|nr:MBL fold metallo-hydrolase [Candidatus Neomarinimicrobiota bacterium]
MSEPKARASEVNYVFPWLLHFRINDERIGDFRGDGYALKSSDGLVVIDPVTLEDEITHEVAETKYVILSAGGHQRSSWRYRKEFGATVYAPVGSKGLDEEPDHWYSEGDKLPAGIKAVAGNWFKNTCHLLYTHTDDTTVLFCGDLITQSEGGPYRFPIGENMPPYEQAREEVKRLLELSATALCPGHAEPTADGCNAALQNALDYKY